MFHQGQIVFGPCPSADGSENIPPHYLVVLQASVEGVLCMFTTSLKERTGGVHAFTQEERAAAGFAKPCRFDPSRLVLYSPKDCAALKLRAGRLQQKMLKRLIHAAQSAKASYVEYQRSA